VRHPVPSRIKAYALYQIDFDDEVKKHAAECPSCATLIQSEQRKDEETHALNPAEDSSSRAAP
jgi:hypothetical protein